MVRTLVAIIIIIIIILILIIIIHILSHEVTLVVVQRNIEKPDIFLRFNDVIHI